MNLPKTPQRIIQVMTNRENIEYLAMLLNDLEPVHSFQANHVRVGSMEICATTDGDYIVHEDGEPIFDSIQDETRAVELAALCHLAREVNPTMPTDAIRFVRTLRSVHGYQNAMYLVARKEVVGLNAA